MNKLLKDLQYEFPGIKGFSARNIWRMREFYLAYFENVKLPPLVAEIGWTHNYVILEKCKDDLQREFYIRMTRRFGWTKNVLIHQIDNQTYEKTLLNQVNFGKTLPEELRNQAKLAVRDEYVLRDSSRPIGVAAYRMVSSLPEELCGQLPEPEQVALLMADIQRPGAYQRRRG